MQVAEKNLSQTIVEAESIMLDMPQVDCLVDNRIWRSHDPKEINELINNSEINENDELDAASTIKDNVWLLGHGFFSFFINQGNGLYEVHIGVMPQQRGKIALKQAKKALDFMFFETDCLKVVGIIPLSNKSAIKFGRLLGFKSCGIVKHEYMRGGIIECEKLILKKEFN